MPVLTRMGRGACRLFAVGMNSVPVPVLTRAPPTRLNWARLLRVPLVNTPVMEAPPIEPTFWLFMLRLPPFTFSVAVVAVVLPL